MFRIAMSSKVTRSSLVVVIVSLFCCAPEALGQRIRRNYRALTPAAREKFRDAIVAMKADVSDTGVLKECSSPVAKICDTAADCDDDATCGLEEEGDRCEWYNKYDKYVCWHDRCGCILTGGAQHSRPLILPWHRELLVRFENEIRAKPGFENVTIPYWKWTEPFPRHLNGPDNDGPGDNDFMGSKDAGFFFESGNWTNRVGGDLLDRSSASAIDTVKLNQSTIDVALSQPDYENFRPYLENLHDEMHVTVGGNVGDPASAADDPVFWLAHCYFDCMWAAWERTHNPDYRPDTANFGDAYSPGNDADDVLTPWEQYKINPHTIRDVLNVKDLGYDYDSTHEKPIPAVSSWGLMIMLVLLLAGGKVYFGRRRASQT